ncbi:hypothetical protein [Thiomicrorhabdus cannonii]|uniref:hypothetical protein n=1 Tax=Thiomicrorhabdus cannonii TaxID=2748011 RepID=UPI0015BB6A92|nr:hypothetical protein [Thiomicrorhabdus cannonii]
MKRLLLIALLWSPQAVWAQTQSQQVKDDFHLTLYKDVQGSVEGLEVFTKQADQEVFFGVSCNAINPFPMLQILLFNDAIISESPRLMALSYRIDGPEDANAQPVQGILQPKLNYEEISNKVRLELKPEHFASMAAMKQGYQDWMAALKAGNEVVFTLSHASFGQKRYAFSLRGFQGVIEPYEAVCY